MCRARTNPMQSAQRPPPRFLVGEGGFVSITKERRYFFLVALGGKLAVVVAVVAFVTMADGWI